MKRGSKGAALLMIPDDSFRPTGIKEEAGEKKRESWGDRLSRSSTCPTSAKTGAQVASTRTDARQAWQ